jgi:hypothetical protein
VTRARVDPAVLDALRFQRRAFDAASLASPLYAALTDAAIADVEAGGACASVLAAAPAGIDPIPDALSLRFLGAVHRLVLRGGAPDLARFFATAGGSFGGPDDAGPAGAAFVAAVAEHRDELVAGLERGVQTNEVGRCATLAVGFTALLRQFGLPLRLLEVGASAGLNLRWDRWRYESGPTSWGDPRSALRFVTSYRDPFPAVDAPVGPGGAVSDRLGCDRAPIDPTTSEGRLALTAFVWPDQAARHERLSAALDAAAAVPATLDAEDAGSWCERRLAHPTPGVTSVVYHSIVWQYLPAPTRARMAAAIEAAGARATADAPVAWLRYEPGRQLDQAAEVRLRAWPAGADTLLAHSGYHGHPVWAA